MGLDMYLYTVEKGASPDEGKEIAYWRKANAVHRWFIERCASGVDDCQPVRVQSEVLPDLYLACQAVLANHDLAGQLLPTESGFFFGPTEYDDWYFEGLEETVKMLDAGIISNPDVWGDDVYYQASW
jgi:hypothetical protein